jgi:hypothetical protein
MSSRAQPQRCIGQPKTHWAKSHTTANGMANERTPINTLAGQLALSETGSISAPARNVSTPLPSNARKLVHSVDCSTWCRCPALVPAPAMPMCSVPPSNPTARLPAITPTSISMSATEIPVRIEIRLPTRARPIQTAAINQMFSSIKNSFRWKESLAHAVFLFRKANSIALAGLYRHLVSDQPED